MIIYGALIIPFITAIVLFKFYRKETLWWELVLPLVASLILIVAMKSSIEAVQVRSTEYWGSFIKSAEYYEDWDEWISKTCTSTCCCDSKGNNCKTTTYDCSYREYHPPRWEAVTTTDETISISESEYLDIKNRLGNSGFIELNRSYYQKDGNEYISQWNNDSTSAVPVTTAHSYENRIKVADQSVFHYSDVSKEDVKKYQLKSYPDLNGSFYLDAVIGDNSKDALIANEKVKYINGLLGKSKQVRCFILVFKNQPIEAALYQEALWSGGNKNEFIVCIGVDGSRKVKWCKPVSWTTSEQLKADVRRFVENQEALSLTNLAVYLQDEINEKFVRRSFSEFNYLTVEPPTWCVILAYLITIGLNFALSLWITKNNLNEYSTY